MSGYDPIILFFMFLRLFLSLSLRTSRFSLIEAQITSAEVEIPSITIPLKIGDLLNYINSQAVGRDNDP